MVERLAADLGRTPGTRSPDDVIPFEQLSEEHCREWRDLLRRLTGNSYFLSPDWTIAWWNTLGRRTPSDCAMWRNESGVLEAVANLSRWKERFHPRVPLSFGCSIITGSGPGAADHLGVAAIPPRQIDAWTWVLGGASRRPRVLRNLGPEYRPAERPKGAMLLERVPCPRLDLVGSGDAAVGSEKLRGQLRAYERRLLKEGVTFRWVAPPDMTADTVDRLLYLHEQRWQLKEERSTLLPGQRELHHRLIERARSVADGSGPAAVVAQRDGRIVGLLYGFLWQGVFSYYQSGWEPEWSRLSLGTVLVSRAIALAANHSAHTFDFLRGAEQYKYRFGATDQFDESWLVRRRAGVALELKYRAKAAAAKRGGG